MSASTTRKKKLPTTPPTAPARLPPPISYALLALEPLEQYVFARARLELNGAYALRHRLTLAVPRGVA
jgi:hypothetical protein